MERPSCVREVLASTRAGVVLCVVTVGLLATRWYAAHRLGFGDAEALYATYARHPQAVYLDHPGLIGWLARVVGGGDCPSPLAAHRLSTVAATLAPWTVALVARALGSSWTGALVAALAIAVTPLTSVGLYAFTPDILLFFAWYAGIGFAARALIERPGSTRALAFTLASALAAGFACNAKASGVLLLLGIALAFSSSAGRAHRRTIAPYLALAVVAILVTPVVRDEITRSFPMLRHRLVETQRAPGLSLRNVGALFGGQALYLTPPTLVAAVLLARDLFAKRHQDAVSRVLWFVTLAASPLLVLCLVSSVAEPHWPAPVYLALPLHLARNIALPGALSPRQDLAAKVTVRGLGRALGVACVSFGLLATVLVHAWVLVPLGPRIAPEAARHDLANDLVAWPTALPIIRRALQESATVEGPPSILVGSHWTLCAQIAAGLPRSVLVGCNSPEGDDWNDWLPRSTWQRAPVILYVTDSRGFGAEGMPPDRHADATWPAPVHRGGLLVRTVTVTRLTRAATASAAWEATTVDRSPEP